MKHQFKKFNFKGPVQKNKGMSIVRSNLKKEMSRVESKEKTFDQLYIKELKLNKDRPSVAQIKIIDHKGSKSSLDEERDRKSMLLKELKFSNHAITNVNKKKSFSPDIENFKVGPGQKPDQVQKSRL